VADAPRLFESVVDAPPPGLDPDQGLYIRVSTIAGTAVDSAFSVQIGDFTEAT
jgi:hypothetical protein